MVPVTKFHQRMWRTANKSRSYSSIHLLDTSDRFIALQDNIRSFTIHKYRRFFPNICYSSTQKDHFRGITT
jgi:hypothetical protein